MTYKKMIEGIVERESSQWLEQFFKSERYFCITDNVEIRKEATTCLFVCKLRVLGMSNIFSPVYSVGGTIGESGIVYKSVIRNESDNIVWASTEELRELENITDFYIE